MKWIGVTGSWRYVFPEIIGEVEREINSYLDKGYGIISGGAPGVDFWATEVALIRFPDGSRVKIIIPTELDVYIQSNREEVVTGELSQERVDELIGQLSELEKVGSLIVNDQMPKVTRESFRSRNDAIVANSDKLLAFQVNKSNGVQYTIDKAKENGVKVSLFSYKI